MLRRPDFKCKKFTVISIFAIALYDVNISSVTFLANMLFSFWETRVRYNAIHKKAVIC